MASSPAAGNQGDLPPPLKPIAWLMGTWRSTSANGSYPNIQPFQFTERLAIECKGQPLLVYTDETWHLSGRRMHNESGFIRIVPDTGRVALLLGHNFGLTEISEGTVAAGVQGQSLTLEALTPEYIAANKSSSSSDAAAVGSLGRTSFASSPFVTAIRREFSLGKSASGAPMLEQRVHMATQKTPALTLHLHITYEREEEKKT